MLSPKQWRFYLTKKQYLWSPQRIETRFYLSQLGIPQKKAARKRKRKDGMTAVKKAEEEAQRVAKAADRNRKHAEKEAEEEAQRGAKIVAKAADRNRKRAEKEAEEEAQRVAKIAERYRKRAEKAEEEETQRAAKAAELDAKWSAENDATIERMIDDVYSYDEIASELGNGLTKMDIYNRWTRYLEELSGIIKPAVKPGPKSRHVWTAEDDAAIVRMRTDGWRFLCKDCIGIGRWPN
jgi:flagellar biosynthesis GTPase FlhF